MAKHHRELTVEEMTLRANGVSHIGEARYEAPFVLGGERYSGRVVSRKYGTDFVLPEKILAPAETRRVPDCAHFGTCAACHIRHVDYDESVRMKTELFQKAFREVVRNMEQPGDELSKIIDTLQMKPAPNPFYYRNNGRFVVQGGRLKLHSMLTHENFHVKECYTVTEGIWNVAQVLAADLPPSIVHIDIRDNHQGAYLVQVTDKNGATRVMGASEIPYTLKIHGREFIFIVGADSFFQVHTTMAELLYEAIVEQVPASGLVYDLYAGTGTIGTIAAALHPEINVISMEIGEEMVRLGRANAAANRVENVHFVQQDVRTVELDRQPAMILVDPPRNGLSRASLSHMMTLGSEHFMYVSCNPETFLRDMQTILGHYRLESVELFDMMPFTSHMELLAVFSRRA